MLNNGEAAFVWVRALSLYLSSLWYIIKWGCTSPSQQERTRGRGAPCLLHRNGVGGSRGEGVGAARDRCSFRLGVRVCVCVSREDYVGTPNNGQERHKNPPAWSPSPLTSPLHTHTHKHAASLQKYLEPICTNDSPCLMHFLEDGAGYSFGRREGVGEVSGRSALPYGFPSACFSRPIFQDGTRPHLVQW